MISETGNAVPVAERAALISLGVLRLFSGLGYSGLTELTLANGRRADVAAIGPKGEIAIVEVKSCLQDFAVDRKWPDYQPFCDRFYFAVDAAFPRDRLPDTAGLIVADRFGGAILREPETVSLAGARRKAVTLRFARHAADRLSRLL